MSILVLHTVTQQLTIKKHWSSSSTTHPSTHQATKIKTEKKKEFYILNRKHFTDQVLWSCPWAGEVVCFCAAAETDLQLWSYCTIQNQTLARTHDQVELVFSGTSLSWILVLSVSVSVCGTLSAGTELCGTEQESEQLSGECDLLLLMCVWDWWFFFSLSRWSEDVCVCVGDSCELI
jgi:hypothetical protein